MSSFYRNLQREIRLWRRRADAGEVNPLYRHNDKLSARGLAQSLDLRVAESLHGPVESPWDLPPTHGPVVIKPVHGSGGRGVFVLTPSGGLWSDLRTGQTCSWVEMQEAAQRALESPRNLSLLSGRVLDAARPPWIAEKPILRAPNLISHEFCCFTIGGNVEVILQVERSPTGTRSKWWTPQWDALPEIMPSPKRRHDNTLPPPSDGAGVIKGAEAVADATHATLVRADFFDGPHGAVFGEITPLTGNGRFIPEWDERLGRVWDSALR